MICEGERGRDVDDFDGLMFNGRWGLLGWFVEGVEGRVRIDGWRRRGGWEYEEVGEDGDGLWGGGRGWVGGKERGEGLLRGDRGVEKFCVCVMLSSGEGLRYGENEEGSWVGG